MGWKPERIVTIPNKDLLSFIFDELEYEEDRPIYIDADKPDKFITNADAQILIRKIVAGLHSAGLQKGDCVCVHARNSIIYPILFLAIIGAGGIFTGTNPASTPHELAHYVETSGAKYFIVDNQIKSSLSPILEVNGVSASQIFLFNDEIDHVEECYLFQQGESDWVRFDDEETSKETAAARLFSSGTTGLPKAASISHHNIVAQHVLTHGMDEKNFEVRHLVCLPMFHTGTIFVTHTSALKIGIQSFVMRSFELEHWLYHMDRFRINEILPLVPPIVVAVTQSPLTENYRLGSVMNALCGAAPIEKGPLGEFKSLLHPDATVTQIWGMTEATFVATRFTYPEDDNEGSVGYPIANMEMKLVDEEGNDITGVNVKGEICLKGPTIIKGYLQNEANQTAFDNEGFLRTGDVGYRNEPGKVFILDRRKELIKVDTFQVVPSELEAVLLEHQQITDCAVIGVPLPETGYEGPRAYIVRNSQENSLLSEEEVKEHLASKLASYKQLSGGVVFVNSIPKTGSGKILKRFLREQASKELGNGKL